MSDYNRFSIIWKAYQVLREDLEISKIELDELS